MRKYEQHGFRTGGRRTAEYAAWIHMIQRCNNPSNPRFQDYGGRGIRVCERWEEFSNFIHDMGLRPSTGHSIERINNDGNYEPNNCRWATRKQQGSNKRNNTNITCDGVTQTIAAWADQLGVSQQKLRHRVKKGWSHERTVKE